MLVLTRLSHHQRASFIFRCPGCRPDETENRRDKGYANSKLGSQGVVIFAICDFERSDYSANSPNALHAYLLISILSIPVDPVFLALVIGHWSLVIGHWSLGIRHWSLVIDHLALFVCLCPFSFILCPFSFVLCPLSFILYPLSFVLCLSTNRH